MKQLIIIAVSFALTQLTREHWIAYVFGLIMVIAIVNVIVSNVKMGMKTLK